jgi:acyl-CoA dehydrogenase
LNEGSKDLKDEIARDVITGKKIMSLAVTEPTAGSDVAGLSTTAVREGDFYVVNGLKKFITGGTRASYFTSALTTTAAAAAAAVCALSHAHVLSLRDAGVSLRNASH